MESGYIIESSIQVTSATTKLRNTGRALVVDVEPEAGQEGRLSGGPLPEEYVLLQVQIGSTNWLALNLKETMPKQSVQFY